MTTKDKFTKFLSINNGQLVEKVDPSSPNQCFDLAIAWCEYLGLPLFVFSGLKYAYQIWSPSTTVAGNNFEYILNTPDAVPQAGDLIVWAKVFNGTGGHVGIATGNFSDTTKFQCFEQNDPTGNNSHLKDYNYNHVLGWLRFKESPTNNALTECLRFHKELVDETVLLKKQLTEKDVVISTQTQELLKTTSELDEAKKQSTQLALDLVAKEELRAKWFEAYKLSKQSLDSCNKDRTTFQKQLTEYQNKQDYTIGELLVKIWEKIKKK